jgi:hypothetical protein
VKSEIYRDFLPLLNSGRVVLPRNERLMRQLCSLERTTARGSGRDNIDHPSGQHDDIANAVAGAAVLAAAGAGYNLDLLAKATAWDDEGDYETNQEARDQQFRNEFAARIFAFSGGMCWPR